MSRRMMADELEISDATVQHIEDRVRAISKIQYLALRRIFDEKITRMMEDPEKQKDGQTMQDVLRILVDQGDDYLGEKDELCSVIDEAKILCRVSKFCHEKSYDRVGATIRREIRLWQLSNS